MKKNYYLFLIVFFVVVFFTASPVYAAVAAPINANISYLAVAGMAVGIVALIKLRKMQPKH
jgi:steroid 5-alpha reductase family enzyme